MKEINTRPKTPESSEMPFFRERIICRINALIEVMRLPVTELNATNSTAIAEKLLELSNDKTLCIKPLAQDMQLCFIISKMCEDNDMVEKVLALAEKKFDRFIKTQELV